MRRRYKNRTGIVIIAFVVLVLCGIVTNRKLELDHQSAKADQKIVELKDKINDQEERAADIKDRENYMKSQEYIKDIARDKLGLVDKDDVIFKSKE